MIKRYIFSLVACATVVAPVEAANFVELGVGAGQEWLNIRRKRGIDAEDNSGHSNISLAIYRQASPKSYWGVGFDYSTPIGRDAALPGSGKILGLRPVNYYRRWTPAFASEWYAGAAEYQWLRTTIGYYFGTSVRYRFPASHWAAAVDVKYYQDLSFDSGAGDDIVDGFSSAFKVFYRF